MTETGKLKVQASASLRSLALTALRKEISEGRLAPGTRLVERELCDAFGVSRTVVREAIRYLEAEGYVAIAPRRGPIVAPLDVPTIRSIYEIREVLEGLAANLFVQRATAEDRERVVRGIDRLTAAAATEDHEEILDSLAEFTKAMNVGSGNVLMSSVLAPLTGRIHILKVRGALSPVRRKEALRQLQALAAALLGDDPEAATRAARERLAGAAAFAMSTLEHPIET